MAFCSRAVFVFASDAHDLARLRDAFLLLTSNASVRTNPKTNCRALQKQSRLLQTETSVARRAVYRQFRRARRRHRRDHRLSETDFSTAGERGIFQLRKNFQPSREVRAG